MKLDIMYEIDAPKPWGKPHPNGQREAEQAAYKRTLEQVRLADEVGFNCVWLVEHHFREGRSHCPSPEVVHGAFSQITEQIRLGFGVTLMPHEFTPPMRVAEKVAVVDVLSGGRVEWGTGRSTPMEQMAFGVDIEKSKDKAQAAIKSVVGMWESEYYEEHSEYLEFPKRMVTPKPVQDPHPAPWMAATSSGSSELAGSLGMGLLSFAILQPVSSMAKTIAGYRKAQETAQPITRVHNDRVAAYTLAHVAPTMDQAEENDVWESVWWWYHNLAQFTLEWEFSHLPQDQQDAYFPFLKQHADGDFDPRAFNDQDMIIVGDPDQAMEKILHYESIGVDQLICYQSFGHLSHEAVMGSIELLGKEIVPELEKRGHRVEIHGPDPEIHTGPRYDELTAGAQAAVDAHEAAKAARAAAKA
ncbi:MAG: LLM class flavin-dependent oxidoreductase [Actinobacteria bacterium]|nr:LLM class flavin-dependent oxidoreductase [Actinomycetota bacterium]